MQKLISIIIPAYNAEKYLEKCVLSAVEQDIPAEQMEIIIIDNLSTDSTAHIINSLAERYDNIVAARCLIAGVGEARNVGISIAKGQYIMFVDSDDTLVKNSVAKLLGITSENNLDMLSFDYQEILENAECSYYNYYKKIKPQYTEKIHTGQQFLVNNHYTVTVWSYLFRRDFLNNNNIQFTNDYHEDDEFTTHTLLLCESIMHTSQVAYNYLIRKGSKMDQRNNSTSLNKLNTMHKIKNLANMSYVCKEAQNTLRKMVDREVYRIVCSSIRRRDNGLYQLIELCDDLNLRPISLRNRPLKTFLFNNHFDIFVSLAKIIYRKK